GFVQEEDVRIEPPDLPGILDRDDPLGSLAGPGFGLCTFVACTVRADEENGLRRSEGGGYQRGFALKGWGEGFGLTGQGIETLTLSGGWKGEGAFIARLIIDVGEEEDIGFAVLEFAPVSPDGAEITPLCILEGEVPWDHLGNPFDEPLTRRHELGDLLEPL